MDLNIYMQMQMRLDELDGQFLIVDEYCQLEGYRVVQGQGSSCWSMVWMLHLPYPNGLNCMRLLIYPSVIHSYCPYIDTDDLQQMTPVCIISSVVVGLEPPHVN